MILENKVYMINPRKYYRGFSFVSAENTLEANRYIEKFMKDDPNNYSDSFGYTYVAQGDLLKNLYSTDKGIIFCGIEYVG
jgi:hypothetical protein